MKSYRSYNRSIMNYLRHSLDKFNPKYFWLVLFVYVVSMIIVTIFHEPWYDEAQSWLIARDASILDIITKIPHYEGHPPLWHLYLIPFAKLGLPYLIGIKSASIIIMSIAMGLLLFKAPFPVIYRLLIPFTFYFFFQYGVISRCYSLLVLGFVLTSMTWTTKDIKPFRFVLSLMLVCAASAYGIIFAAGIALVWVINILKQGYPINTAKGFLYDRRIYALLSLLVFALLLVYLIIPHPDTYALNLHESISSFGERLFFMLIIVPMESLFFTSFKGSYFLHNIELTQTMIIVSSVVFFIFAFIMILFGYKKKKLLLLIVPYSIFTLFCSLIYISSHHYGIVTTFILFWFWVSNSDCPSLTPSRGTMLTRILVHLLIIFSLTTSTYWTISSVITETNTNYDPSQDIVEFIKAHQLENEMIMLEWYSPENMAQNPNHQIAPSINAYFEKNILYAFNNGKPNLSYDVHKVYSDDEVKNIYSLWESKGAPAALIGKPNLSDVFNGNVTYDDYALVKIITSASIVKAFEHEKPLAYAIYFHRDLLEKYDLTPLMDVDWTKYSNSEDFSNYD